MVHITGKRYKRRAESRNTIRVYSNAEDVELFVNSKSMGAMCKDCHIFWLDGVVPVSYTHLKTELEQSKADQREKDKELRRRDEELARLRREIERLGGNAGE